MFNTTTLQALLGIWVVWHLVFGVLATLAPETGAAITGWSPDAGWTADLLAMSTQYGMVMLLLALVYAVMMFDRLRYLGLIWVAIGEQALGIAYAIYIYMAIGTVTVPQLAIQSLINLAIIAILFAFWTKLHGHARLSEARA